MTSAKEDDHQREHAADGLKLQIRVFGACSPERLTTLADALDDVGGRAFRIFEGAFRDLATSKS